MTFTFTSYIIKENKGGLFMEINKLKNAIGYIRVSTEGQAGDDKFGIAAQKQAILLYADANGYCIAEWKIDEISGAKDERPALDEILYGDNIGNPPIEAVIVFKNDRLARNTKLYFYYLYVLEKKNIKLLSTKEEFDEGNDFTNVYRSLLQFVAEQERKNIALRTGQGRALKASCGGYSGGKAPYGYKVDKGRLVIEENEATNVRKVFELKDQMPMLRIAEYFNDSGLNTRSGGKFYASNIKTIIENEPVYRGMYRYGRGKDKKDIAWVKGVHEPILAD